jgi:hypothetical protein
MRGTAPALAAAALVAAPAAALAAKALSYQGFSAQGHEISFKRGSAGVFSMKVGVRARCMNDQGQNQGDYDFTLRATDTIADPVKRGRFTVVLPGNASAPTTTIKGALNRRGIARGTIKASGRVNSGGSDLGTCTSGAVRWTAGP